MLQIQDALKLEPLDDFLKKRSDERAQHYKERRDRLARKLGVSSPATPSGDVAGAQSAEALQALQSVMARKKVRRTPQEWDSLAKLERDPLKQAQIYEDGLRALPKSAWMHEYAALYFSDSAATQERADQLHREAMALGESDAGILGNYANFLTDIRKDHDAAEALYKRALEADPNNADNLGNYASFLTDIRKDHDAAETLYKRALEADPNHSDNLGNYARSLLATNRVDESLVVLERAIGALAPGDPMPIDAECWMYAHCCRPVDQQPAALAQIKKLVIGTEVRTGAWDFSGVIKQAIRLRHPESAWLPKLARVLSGQESAQSLDEWKAWRNA